MSTSRLETSGAWLLSSSSLINCTFMEETDNLELYVNESMGYDEVEILYELF